MGAGCTEALNTSSCARYSRLMSASSSARMPNSGWFRNEISLTMVPPEFLMEEPARMRRVS
ncbi:unnamed protein product, partial [Plutella xylostella]